MNDELEQKSDAELNEIFARDVAQIVSRPSDIGPAIYQPDGYSAWLPVPDFCGDARAVLPWLEKVGWKGAGNRSGDTSLTTVFVCCQNNHSQEVSAISFDRPNDFCRAACIALIRAKRAEKS